MVRDIVSFGDHSLEDVGVESRLHAHDVEGRPHTPRFEHVQQQGRDDLVRSVVEGEHGDVADVGEVGDGALLGGLGPDTEEQENHTPAQPNQRGGDRHAVLKEFEVLSSYKVTRPMRRTPSLRLRQYAN